jgi:ABC-2 type transport system ATP-binding protein
MMDTDEGLVFRGVTRRFRNVAGRAAVEALDLECLPGRITALVGPNGAGKSTALALAAGLLEASAGALSFAGRLIGPARPPSALAYLPQESTFLAGLRVGEVLRMAHRARGADHRTWQESLELGGLSPILERPVDTLSSGWQRRLGLALATPASARLVLLDEPFVGLDLDTLERAVDLLDRRAAGGATVVVASHDFEVLDRLSPRLAVFDEGRLLRLFETTSGASCRQCLYGVLSRSPAVSELPPDAVQRAEEV